MVLHDLLEAIAADTTLNGLQQLRPPDAAPDVLLWSFDLDCFTHEQVEHLRATVLSAGERERASRWRFQRDARRYVAGRSVVRRLLGHATASEPADLVLADGEHGKPYLSAFAHLQFNLSHSGHLALLALGTGAALGVDIELHVPMVDRDAVARRCFTDSEYNALRSASDPDGAFYTLWARKEACLKALGSGFSIEPHVFDAGMQTGLSITSIPTPDGPRHVRVQSIGLGLAASAAIAWMDEQYATVCRHSTSPNPTS